MTAQHVHDVKTIARTLHTLVHAGFWELYSTCIETISHSRAHLSPATLYSTTIRFERVQHYEKKNIYIYIYTSVITGVKIIDTEQTSFLNSFPAGFMCFQYALLLRWMGDAWRKQHIKITSKRRWSRLVFILSSFETVSLSGGKDDVSIFGGLTGGLKNNKEGKTA